MATAKKPVAKKTTAKKKPATKKPIAKKTTPKKSAATTRRVPVLTAETEPFFTFRITRQTIYWLIVALAVLALGIWVNMINMRVQELYDKIDAQVAEDALQLNDTTAKQKVKPIVVQPYVDKK